MTGNKRFLQSRHKCIDRVKKRRTETWDTVIVWLNELHDENTKLKERVDVLQETLAYRSNQAAYAEYLINEYGSPEMCREWEEFIDD